MDDEKLILLVQANECVYNKYCPGYKNQEKKKKDLEANFCIDGSSKEVCQKRWSPLRDRYAKEKRQENLPLGSGAKYKSPWVLMRSMDFIAPHIVPRPMRSSCSMNREIYDNNSQSSSSPTALPSPLSTQSPTIVSSPLLEVLSEESLLEPIKETQTTPVMSKRKRPLQTDENQSSQAVDAFKNLCEGKINKPEENDALAGFGKIIVEVIRTMGPSKQLIAMQKMTSLVMKMKLEEDNSYEHVLETDIE